MSHITVQLGFVILMSWTWPINCVKILQPPDILVEYMGKEEIFCSHDDSILAAMLWYRQTSGTTAMALIGYGINLGKPNNEPDFPSVRFELKRTEIVKGSLALSDLTPSDSAVYFCAASDNNQPAYFGQGTKLTVLENGLEITRPIVKVFPPSKEEICDRDIHKKRKSLSVTLVCVAKDFYPDHVSVIWKINGDDQSQKGAVGKVGTDNSATRDKNGKYYSITSRLRIPLKTWGNAKNTFTCRVDFYNGTHNDPEEASINGQLVPGMPDPDKPLKSAQTAKFAYGIFIAKSCVFGLFIFIFVKKMSRGAKDGKW